MSTVMMNPLMYGPAGAGAPQDPATLAPGQVYLVEGLDGRCSFRATYISTDADGRLVFLWNRIEFKVPPLAANFWKSA